MFKKIFEIYKKYEEIINYLIFGVLSTVISIASFALFNKVFHIHYNVCNILSWILAVSFAFVTNKLYVFKSKETNIIKDLIKFFASRIATLIIEVIIMFIMVDLIKIDEMISKVIAQIIVIILNYVFSKIFVFNKKSVV